MQGFYQEIQYVSVTSFYIVNEVEMEKDFDRQDLGKYEMENNILKIYYSHLSEKQVVIEGN